MKKNLLVIVSILLLIACHACNNASIKKSANILPMDSVAVMIADCYFLESEISVKQHAYDMKDYALVKYASFFEKRRITKEIFMDNVRYYITNEKYAEKMMNKVDEIVEQRAAALRDSLNVIQ
jgi:hypothetical protein